MYKTQKYVQKQKNQTEKVLKKQCWSISEMFDKHNGHFHWYSHTKEFKIRQYIITPEEKKRGLKSQNNQNLNNFEVIEEKVELLKNIMEEEI